MPAPESPGATTPCEGDRECVNGGRARGTPAPAATIQMSDTPPAPPHPLSPDGREMGRGIRDQSRAMSRREGTRVGGTSGAIPALALVALLLAGPPVHGTPAHPPAPHAVASPSVAPVFVLGWMDATSAQGPSSYECSIAVYDPIANATTCFGIGAAGFSVVVWQRAGGSWSNLTGAAGHGPTTGLSANPVFDVVDGYVLFPALSPRGAWVQTWAFDHGLWVNLTVSAPSAGNTPPGRQGASAAYDPILNAVLLFGGSSGRLDFNDTWSFSNATWTNLTVSGGLPPAGRRSAYLAYDPDATGTVLFGGCTFLCTSYRSDTWVFAGGAWTNVTSATVGVPSARAPPVGVSGAPCVTYDAADRFLVLAQGATTLFPFFANDTWAYRPGSWSKLQPLILPTPALGHSFFCRDLVEDGASGRVLMIAGGSSTGSGVSAPVGVWTFGLVPNVTAFIVTNFTITPNAPLVGANLTFTVVVSGGNGSYRYSYSGLPAPCLSVNRSVLRCAAGQNGNFRVTVSVVDDLGDRCGASLNISIALPASPPPGPTPFLGPNGPIFALGLLAGGVIAGAIGVWIIARRRRRGARPPAA